MIVKYFNLCIIPIQYFVFNLEAKVYEESLASGMKTYSHIA